MLKKSPSFRFLEDYIFDMHAALFLIGMILLKGVAQLLFMNKLVKIRPQFRFLYLFYIIIEYLIEYFSFLE